MLWQKNSVPNLNSLGKYDFEGLVMSERLNDEGFYFLMYKS